MVTRYRYILDIGCTIDFLLTYRALYEPYELLKILEERYAQSIVT